MEFEIGDIIEQNGHNDSLLVVVGVIHDNERLFIIDPASQLNNGNEFEISFGEVTRHWRELLNQSIQPTS